MPTDTQYEQVQAWLWDKPDCMKTIGYEEELMPDGTTEVMIKLRSKPEVKDE